MITALIIDDEPLAIQEFCFLLKKYGDIEVVDTVLNPSEAIKKIEILNPDVIFLDIRMPGKTGFDLLEELTILPHIVFVTAYDAFALKAFEVNALDYLMKPVNRKRLDETIEKIRNVININHLYNIGLHRKIYIKDKDQHHFIHLTEIIMFETYGNYVKIHYSNKKALIHKSLNYIHEHLPETTFFRANRQFIFNINHVKSITNEGLELVVELINSINIRLSQRQSVLFRELYGNLDSTKKNRF